MIYSNKMSTFREGSQKSEGFEAELPLFLKELGSVIPKYMI